MKAIFDSVPGNTLASHQMRLSGAEDPFEHSVVVSALEELRDQGFIRESPEQALALSPLGRLVARSGLSVRSAIKVARVFRGVTADELNRATLITAAQLTDEVDQVVFPLNYKGHRTEMSTFGGQLQQQLVAGAAIQALYDVPFDKPHLAALRAKKAVACLLWTRGVPATDLEPALMRHTPVPAAAAMGTMAASGSVFSWSPLCTASIATAQVNPAARAVAPIRCRG